MSRNPKKAPKGSSPEPSSTNDSPPRMVPNQEAVHQAIDQVVSTLNNPEYRDQLTKLTQLSIINSIQTAQKLSSVTTRMSRMDNDEIAKVVSSSAGDMMRLYLQFNSELITLVQKVMNRAVEILDNATPSPTSEEPPTEPTPE